MVRFSVVIKWCTPHSMGQRLYAICGRFLPFIVLQRFIRRRAIREKLGTYVRSGLEATLLLTSSTADTGAAIGPNNALKLIGGLSSEISVGCKRTIPLNVGN